MQMRGIGLMILGIGLLCTMDALAKLLMKNGMPALQLLALRSVVIVPMMLLIFSFQGNLATLKPTRPILHPFLLLQPAQLFHHRQH